MFGGSGSSEFTAFKKCVVPSHGLRCQYGLNHIPQVTASVAFFKLYNYPTLKSVLYTTVNMKATFVLSLLPLVLGASASVVQRANAAAARVFLPTVDTTSL